MDPTVIPDRGAIARECQALVDRGEHPHILALGRETLRRLGPWGARLMVMTNAKGEFVAESRRVELVIHSDPLGPAEYLHVWSHEAIAKVMADL